jgi:hypothetical protein
MRLALELIQDPVTAAAAKEPVLVQMLAQPLPGTAW